MNNSFTGMEGLNTIITKVIKDLGIERGLKEITFANFWGQIAGPRFVNNSKIVSVSKKYDYDVVFVAVKSASLAQDLFMFKNDILRKMYPIAKSLDFNVKDVVFSPKLWKENINESHVNNETEVEFYLKEPDDEDLKSIEVPETIINSVTESIKTQKFSSDELKDRMTATITKDIKVQIWKKTKGYPFCDNCGIPVNYKSTSGKTLCPSCKYI